MGNENLNVPLAMNSVPIVAFDQRFAFPTPVTLLLKEKIFSFSGDDFKITDIYGNPYFLIKGKVWTMHQRKSFYDLYGAQIFNIKHEIFSLRGRYRFCIGESDNAVVKIDPLSKITNRHFQVTFVNKANGNNEILDLYCDLIGSRCAIFHGDANNGAPCICKIYKEYDAKHFFAGKDNYSIQIAPNVDASLMLGLGAVFDEIKHDDKQSES